MLLLSISLKRFKWNFFSNEDLIQEVVENVFVSTCETLIKRYRKLPGKLQPAIANNENTAYRRNNSDIDLPEIPRT